MPPTKPSGVQLASADAAAGAGHPDQLAGGRAWSAANMTPIAERTTSNDASSYGRFSASASAKLDVQVLGLGAAAGDVEQLGHVVDAGRPRPTGGRRRGRRGRCRSRRRAPASPGIDADVVDEVLGHRDGQGGDLVVVAAAPDLLLLVAELGEVRGAGRGAVVVVMVMVVPFVVPSGDSCAPATDVGGRGDVLEPESGPPHRLGDQVDRVGLVEQEARLVLGDEERLQVAHRPALRVRSAPARSATRDVLLRDGVVALCDVELDEVLGHGSTVLARDGVPKLRMTRGNGDPGNNPS